jgi:hypothetical protein
VSEPNVEAIYPLSPVQAGILFHTLYEQESRVYFEQLCVRYRGPLDLVILRRAWQRMVDRHSILRTLFVWERQKTPLQVVRRNSTGAKRTGGSARPPNGRRRSRPFSVPTGTADSTSARHPRCG